MDIQASRLFYKHSSLEVTKLMKGVPLLLLLSIPDVFIPNLLVLYNLKSTSNLLGSFPLNEYIFQDILCPLELTGRYPQL